MTGGRGADGFSLVEALVALAIIMAAAGVLFHFAAAAQRLARSQPDAADVNQRMRVAAGMIARDLMDAGAGDAQGDLGPLVNYLPPIVPARTGALAPDGELTAFDDRISIVFAPDGAWRARLAADVNATTADVSLDTAGPGCPAAGLCGFHENSRAAIVDRSNLGAGYEIFTVTAAFAALAHGSPNPPFSRTYARASAAVLPVEQRVYYRDAANNRLMVYDGFRTALPLIDNLVDLQFAYFVDPHPASVALPADASGNCAYAPGDPPAPILVPLGSVTLVPVPVARFTDGPLCGVFPNRFDADLLRIRRVRVRLRVQAGLAQSRGQGAHYRNAGVADSGLSAIRDFELTFEVAPRNLQPARLP